MIRVRVFAKYTVTLITAGNGFRDGNHGDNSNFHLLFSHILFHSATTNIFIRFHDHQASICRGNLHSLLDSLLQLYVTYSIENHFVLIQLKQFKTFKYLDARNHMECMVKTCLF